MAPWPARYAHPLNPGALYKPSGAGGGDFGLAFSGDESQLDRLALVYREQGFVVPDLEFSVNGLELAEI